MYLFRKSLMQPVSFAFGLWGLAKQECGMCLQGSCYCWNMSAPLPEEVSEDWGHADSGHPPWTAGVNPGEETGLRARNQGPAEWQSRGGCSPSPSPYSALPLDLAPSPLLLCARMTQDRDCLFAWRHGCFLPLHPRWLQVRTWLKLLRRAVWAATEWHWGVLGPRAPLHLLWAASGKQSAYILTSFRWLAGVSLSGRANASLRIFILFTFPTFFFFSALNIQC